MLRIVKPDNGYCLYLPNRQEGERLVIGQRVRIWFWEEWKHIKLGQFKMYLPMQGEQFLALTKDGIPCKVIGEFSIVIGGSGDTKSIESRLYRLTRSVPATRDIRWKIEFPFFQTWGLNYCNNSIRRAISGCMYENLIAQRENQVIVKQIQSQLATELDTIGMLLVESKIIIGPNENITVTTTKETQQSNIKSYEVSAISTTKESRESISLLGEHLIESYQKPLSVFLCHASQDKPRARALHHRLKVENIDPWLDEEKLLPGQDWDLEIKKAVRESDIVIVCLSRNAINKKGYVQKEIAYALDVATEQPEGTIYIIPLKLEECDVPQRLQKWHWVNLFDEHGYDKLMRSLQQSSRQK